jgi:hypothetical protein
MSLSKLTSILDQPQLSDLIKTSMSCAIAAPRTSGMTHTRRSAAIVRMCRKGVRSVTQKQVFALSVNQTNSFVKRTTRVSALTATRCTVIATGVMEGAAILAPIAILEQEIHAFTSG